MLFETDPNAGAMTYGTCRFEHQLCAAMSISILYTVHTCGRYNCSCLGICCADSGADHSDGGCDKNGWGMQVVGIAGLNGKCWVPGTEFNMNSKQPFAVTIQFINGDGLDVGAITADRQFYTQIGQTIEHR